MVGEAVTAARPPVARTRPRNRKALIVDAAVVLFHRDGYHRVAMEDIASAVGITAGALYRHFSGKQDLLCAAVLAVIDDYLAVAGAAAPGGLDAVLRALAHRSVERRDRGPLWHRHARDLSPDQRARVRRRLRLLAGRVDGALQAARPELGSSDADLLTWAALAVLGSPTEHSVVLARPRMAEILVRVAAAVCGTRRLPSPDPVAVPAPRRPAAADLVPASRREALLVTAGRLFAGSGFDAVTMEAIGAAAGISGPAVYNHFPSKSELLLAVLDRGRDTLRLGLSQALAGTDPPGAALEPVVRSYVRPALRPDGLPGLLFGEAHRLSEQQRHAARRVQRDYLDEWVRLLPAGPVEGRVVVHAAVALVNNLVLIPHLRARPAIEDEIVGLALDALRAA
jgi:AcrR family transcriptional regulator